MNNLKAIIAGVMLAATTSATAGGILTNTNQSIDFLRNPARDAAIGLDGVYSNPAGVAFLPEGFHIAFNWQYAHQTRTITSTNPYFALGRKNNGNATKTFEGVADAPFIPSLQGAYNKGNWSWQFNLSVPGGGGACEFNDGLGSFESVVGSIAYQLGGLDQIATALGQPAPGVSGYDMDGYMQGRQYYFGVQLGAAYKITPDLSVYGGLRFLYGTATYKAKISNIMVKTAGGYQEFGSFLQSATAMVDGGITTVNDNLTLVNAGMAQYEAAGATALPQYQELVATKAQLEGSLATLQGTNESLNSLQKYSEGVNLLCNQWSVGIAPVIGVDWRVGQFNFAAKYEFKTQIRMENESTVNKASEIPAVNKFRDGEKVNEDMPAQLGQERQMVQRLTGTARWRHQRVSGRCGMGCHQEAHHLYRWTDHPLSAYRCLHERHVVCRQQLQLRPGLQLQGVRHRDPQGRLLPDQLRRLQARYLYRASGQRHLHPHQPRARYRL